MTAWGKPLSGLPLSPLKRRPRSLSGRWTRQRQTAHPSPNRAVFGKGSVRVSVPYLEAGVRKVSHRISRQQPSLA